jgi:integrase
MELHLVGTKTGFSRRPMSAAALAVIDSMERMPGVPFVFHSVKSPSKGLSYNTVEKAFGRIVEAAKIENCTLHTIRHWFATMTAHSVSNARVGMALTGHKSHAAYIRYVHSDKGQAQALAEHIANMVISIYADHVGQK